MGPVHELRRRTRPLAHSRATVPRAVVSAAAPTAPPRPATTPPSPFASALRRRDAPRGAPLAPAGSVGQAIVELVRGEVGEAEQPPGSNDSPRIAQYRQATAGLRRRPVVRYFTSWAAREAGVPLGDSGQGFGRVDDVYAWAQRAGKAVPNTGGVTPQPGDLIVWDEHIGVVESVGADGTINTIEGNSSDQVSAAPTRRVRPAIGYVRLG